MFIHIYIYIYIYIYIFVGSYVYVLYIVLDHLALLFLTRHEFFKA